MNDGTAVKVYEKTHNGLKFEIHKYYRKSKWAWGLMVFKNGLVVDGYQDHRKKDISWYILKKYNMKY
tara:strand:- start:43 stop:243 length:201 start_codon:yes stop_codon:yes gene_type:complete